MEWTWEDKRDNKEIKRWLKAVKNGKEANENFDFIANVRSGIVAQLSRQKSEIFIMN